MTGILLATLLATGGPRPAVAVLPPVPAAATAAESDEWLGLAVADNVYHRLIIHSRYDPANMQRVYPLNMFGWRQALSAARKEGIDTSKPLSVKSSARLARQLGADHIFTGSYTIKGGTVQLTWQLLDPKKKRKASKNKQEIALSDVNAATDLIGSKILEQIGQSAAALGGHKLPAVPLAAMRSYGAGLRLLSQQSLDPRARLVLSKDQIETARARFNGATDASPSFVRGWVEQAIASAMLGDDERAEEAMVQAMAQAGEFVPATSLGLYYLYERQGKQDEAIEVLEEATTTHLGFLHGLGYLGSAYLRNARSHDALQIFTSYQARVPASPWARVMRGVALSRIGKHKLAIEETRAVHDEFPGSIMVATALASRQIDAGHHSSARATIQKALKKHPDHPALLTRLSYIQLELNRPLQALELAEGAVAALGKGRGETLAGYAHLNLAHALARLGRTEEALAALKEAVALGVTAADQFGLLRDKKIAKFMRDPRNPLRPEARAHKH